MSDIDIQAQKILEGLETLDQLLAEPVAKEALDLGENATTSAQYEVLQRVRKSLRQYLERGGDLFYVGLLGHFSAGKSSTVNSVLGLWGSKDERKTDLHPTDDTITLITQAKNTQSLLGVIKEGHVTIRYQPVDAPLLDSLVLVDTPGTGDPRFLEEVARDFLPICDVILFLFSATSTLNKNDLPLLLELHRRLPFIPIRFVITRADELRRDSSERLTDTNFNQERKARFLNGVVTRMNDVLKPGTYTADQFLLVDNLAPYNIDALTALLQTRFNSSSTQARIQMHGNKLHFYLSAAKELRNFFAEFLEAKLLELNNIVGAAERNIERYNEVVQISNNNLTHAWLDRNAALNVARDRATERLKRLNDLPEQYSAFAPVAKRRAEISKDLAWDAKTAAESIGARVRSSVLPTLKDHFDKAQKAIAAESLDKLSAATHGVTNIKIACDIDDVDFMSPRRLAIRYDDLRSSEAEAMRDSAGELRGAAREIDELLQGRVPFADFEAVVDGAQASLKTDLDRFFQSVELYREGVFAHAAQEAIATLGIGGELQKLHSEFTEDDKSSLAAEAVRSLFPNFNELRAKAATDLAMLSGRARPLLDSLRAFKIERPDDIYGVIESEVSVARSQFQNDLLRELQADADRVCERVISALASVLVTKKAEYDAAMRQAVAARRRRYFLFVLVAAILAFFGYLGFRQFKRHAQPSLLTVPLLVERAAAQTSPSQTPSQAPETSSQAAPTLPQASSQERSQSVPPSSGTHHKKRRRKGRLTPTQSPAAKPSQPLAQTTGQIPTQPLTPAPSQTPGPPPAQLQGQMLTQSPARGPAEPSIPTPHETPGGHSTFEVVAWGVLSELIASGIGLLVARLRDQFPTTVHDIREQYTFTLRNEVRKVIESEFNSHKFEAMNEANLASRLTKVYERVVEIRSGSWHTRASEYLRSLRTLHNDCAAVGSAYLTFVEETHQQCARYFTDASKNLQTLNTVADKIKKQTIEPSFALLDKTRKQLEYVKQQTKAVEFA
jgi:predicted GTPase